MERVQRDIDRGPGADARSRRRQVPGRRRSRTDPGPAAAASAMASVRRLSLLGQHAHAAGDVRRALARELLELVGVDQVHIQQVPAGGAPAPATAYLLGGAARSSYRSRVAPAAPAIAEVSATGQVVTVPEAPADHGLDPEFVRRWRVGSAALLSLGASGRVEAVVILARHEPGEFDPALLDVAVTLCDQAGVALSLVRARAEAQTDPLTGVLNRRAMVRRLNEEVARARRQGSPLACVILDLDDFKPINDRLGHHAGDRVLRVVADTLQEHCRTVDRVARYGGDEFVVILPSSARAGAQQFAERVRSALGEGAPRGERGSAAGEPDGGRVVVSVSVGVAELAPDETARELLARADQALLAGKREGKDRVRASAIRPSRARHA